MLNGFQHSDRIRRAQDAPVEVELGEAHVVQNGHLEEDFAGAGVDASQRGICGGLTEGLCLDLYS